MIPTLTWVLPRPPKSRYKGGFPLYFEDNLVKLLGYPDAILQPFGGRAEHGVRMDLDPLTEPDIVGDAHEIPYPDESFDMVLLDRRTATPRRSSCTTARCRSVPPRSCARRCASRSPAAGSASTPTASRAGLPAARSERWDGELR